MSNVTKIGSLVMFLHDWADIPTSLLKFIVETNFKTATWVIGILNVIVWGYSRILVFPQIIYYGFIIHPAKLVYPNYLVPGH